MVIYRTLRVGDFSFCWWSVCLVRFLLLDWNNDAEERPLLYSVSLIWFLFAVSRLEVEQLDFVPLISEDSIEGKY